MYLLTSEVPFKVDGSWKSQVATILQNHLLDVNEARNETNTLLQLMIS